MRFPYWFALAALSYGCATPPRSTVEVGPGDTCFAKAAIPTGDPGAGRQGLRGPNGWLIPPEHSHVYVISSRGVLTQRTDTDTYQRWVISWHDGVPEVSAPEPTPWRTLGFVRDGKSANELFMVSESQTSPQHLVLASEDTPGEDGTLSRSRESVVAVLGPDGAPLARYVSELEPLGGGLTWMPPRIFGNSLFGHAVDGSTRTTLIFDLSGTLRLPPLPNLQWIGRHWPALELDAELTGLPGLMWPIDEQTGLPATDPSRSVVGFEPLIADGDLQNGTLCGWLKHYRTPDGPRVGFCTVDRVVDHGPVAARGVFPPQGGYPLVLLERPEGGWTVSRLEMDDKHMARRMKFVTRRDQGEPTPEAALVAYEVQREEENRRWLAEKAAREAEERAMHKRVFEARLASDQPYHPYLEEAARHVGQNKAMEYVRKLRPQNVPFLRWVLEGRLSAEDRQFTQALLDERLAEEARVAAELAAEQARRQAAWRAEREEQLRQLRAVETARAEYAEQQARLNRMFDVSGISFGGGGDPGARARAITESLFRHTYGQQDWHWQTR